ncbi:MAG: hypothetical protein IT561_21510 [Alphaproteobacteria bacterium]|nr:hypothetical protein [Alphaproteobacteria bacterium]
MAESVPTVEETRDNVHVLPPRYVGHVDEIDGGHVRGWARNEATPGARIVIDVYLGDQPLGSVTADTYRKDLAAAGFGDGRHAFSFALPPAARTVPPTAIGVYFHGTRIPLVRTWAAAAPEEDGRLVARLAALEGDHERVAAALAAAGKEQREVRDAVAAIERMLAEGSLRRDDERAAAAAAAADAVRAETDELARRLQQVEKAFADNDAFLLRLDERLRGFGEGPAPRPRPPILPIALAMFAIAASGLAILAASAPRLFHDLLYPLLG